MFPQQEIAKTASLSEREREKTMQVANARRKIALHERVGRTGVNSSPFPNGRYYRELLTAQCVMTAAVSVVFVEDAPTRESALRGTTSVPPTVAAWSRFKASLASLLRLIVSSSVLFISVTLLVELRPAGLVATIVA